MDISAGWIVLGAVVLSLALGFIGAPLVFWTALTALILWAAHATTALWIVFAVLALIFNIFPIRAVIVSAPVMKLMKKLKFIPQISPTEQAALKAGDVWIEGELFSGKPDFKRILKESYPELSVEEKAFLDGPVEKICKMTHDWDVWQRRDLPPETWEFLKKERFFGMIIPKEYGGLGFSALAHSEVIQKLATRCLPLCITAMVPNSLGPAELLNHYGTDEQKKYWLPRLARGEEIPCFGLTEPNAGSDAASIQANGVVFKGDGGKLYLKLNWNKRYITLAAASTVIGLAFRLRDPESLLGKGEDVGITCALIPSKTPGVTANHRHDPLGVPFYNCPTQGKDVVVPIDAIIGGAARAGQGWQMLMESLAAGRGISLPAQSTGGAKYVTRITGAHAVVRKQFGMSIGNFEGIQEFLARIGGNTYMLEAARRYTLGAIDSGVKPPVITAMCKYYFTEISRDLVNDGMDIIGGQGISRGPHNLLAHGYIALPIQITVEGANILTRTLIIFGQGALRAHPYAYKEVDALESGNTRAFDRAFWSHVGHVVRNGVRAVLLSITRGGLFIPPRMGATARYYRRLAWSSATFAFLADIAMASLGGKLKAKGKTTGRFADILGWMYLATSTLRRFEAEGRRKEDLPLLHWSMQHAFAQIQKAFDELFANLHVPLVGWFLHGPLRWYGAMNPIGSEPKDALDLHVAKLIQVPGEQRDRLTSGVFVPTDIATEQLARLENAFKLTVGSDDVAHRVRRAVRKKQLKKAPAAQLYRDAVAQGIISQEEFESAAKAEEARNQTIQVDAFSLPEYFGTAYREPLRGPQAAERAAMSPASE